MKLKWHPSLAVLGLIVLASSAEAQTVTVTTTADVVDINGLTGTVADLPGPDGLVSFSEAMIATNNTPGHQLVAFAIPTSQLGWFGPQYAGVAVFHALTGYYWRANDEVTIDGTTQTAFAGDTNADGAEVLLYGNTFYLNDDNSTLRGFHSTSVQSGGANSLIEDNTGGMNLTLFGGAGSLVRNNHCGTIKLDRTNFNVVIGNTLQRVRIQGFGSGQPAAGNRIGGPTLAERNFITGYGTYNSEGLPSGTTVELFYNTGTLIENNWIGTTTDGLSQGSLASNIGIGFSGENHDVTIAGNRIAGILGHGQGPHHAGQLFGWAVLVSGSGSGIHLLGNTIGLDANDQPLLGSVWGISIGDAVTHPASYTDLRIGGPNPGDGNVIAGHIFNGVTVGRDAGPVRLEGNAIHDNGWLGIDLIPTGYGYGVTPNDPLDLDTGGNGLQNFPVIAKAQLLGGALKVEGSLHSSPQQDLTIELFASPACDPSGHGQGEVFLGRTAVSTDALGDASFATSLSQVAPEGWVLTATATLEPSGDTSEHSACLAISGGICQPDLGFGGPGTAVLSVCGDPLTSGGSADLAVTGAPPSAPLWVIFGLASNPTPIFAGTLVPFPPALIQGMSADGTGEAHLAIPGGAANPVDVFAQAITIDATVAFNVGFTNAVQLQLLP